MCCEQCFESLFFSFSICIVKKIPLTVYKNVPQPVVQRLESNELNFINGQKLLDRVHIQGQSLLKWYRTQVQWIKLTTQKDPSLSFSIFSVVSPSPSSLPMLLLPHKIQFSPYHETPKEYLLVMQSTNSLFSRHLYYTICLPWSSEQSSIKQNLCIYFQIISHWSVDCP